MHALDIRALATFRLPFSMKAPRELKEPVSARDLTTRESIILLEASKLHGCVFPPWLSTKPDTIQASGTSFIDDFNFGLSAIQLEDFCHWARVPEILADDALRGPCPLRTHGSLDLVQDLTTDCSVVASLCAITARTENGFNNLCESIFPEWSSVNGVSQCSQHSKYVLCLKFNGCSRKITIDDKLPISKSGRRLFVSNRLDPSILWPALLEKAYLKVRGGYDFPGSNSGTDISVLTGWIPEQVFLQSEGLDRGALWLRLVTAFRYGDVLITIGTGQMGSREEDGSGLVMQHDYAIVEIKSDFNEDLLLVKNPWSCNATDAPPNPCLEKNEMKPFPKFSARHGALAGHFWMTFDQISQHFESLYLNWNPGLFKFRQDAHFAWDLTGPKIPNASFRLSPQYVVQCVAGGVLWLSLARHFVSRNALPTKFQATNEARLDKKSLEDGFVSMYAYKGDCRVYSGRFAIKNSPYVDSPNTLLKLDLPECSSVVIALSQQALPFSKHHFTISCFSLHAFELKLAPDKYSYKYSRRSTWSKTNAGGNSSHHSYHRNPQYRIQIGSSADVCLMLETPSSATAVHIALLWAGGRRVRTITARELVGDSGEYSEGFAHTELTKLAPGTYTAVCSTFDADHFADFDFHVATSSPCQVEQIPALSAGKFEMPVQQAVFRPYTTQLRLPLSTMRFNRLLINIWMPEQASRKEQKAPIPLRATVMSGRGETLRTLATSNNGDFVDLNATGIVLQDVDVQPGTQQLSAVYLMVERLSTSGMDHDEAVEVTIQSEAPLSLGAWIEL